ncbi:prepilin-type N-terminal cleavage/methylation domain-containing protein [Ruficoccus amylovorans]|uniref:Prepilin-type N-terminal cleavage/methylation domain-containing protein n=1 Tax=Ruficoccus amylovorans TaxID=1804625 RepID=A0A842H8V3_9BACT|nr:prepilin-type N-terminal cleavage/methylation domain-containing protein [Ruficoccus amylovorans]MBC2592645.1 prepilin-type N-terminal cleavage/methylation domain-containing protein [Ruficoccus amylovorans]
MYYSTHTEGRGTSQLRGKASVSFAGPIHRAFSLLELLVGITIVTILTTICIVMVGRVRTTALMTESVSNLRSLNQGFSMYIVENSMHYPGYGGKNARARWMHQIAPYLDFKPVVRVNLSGVYIDTYRDAYFESLFRSPATDESVYLPPASMNGIGVYGANPLIITDASAPSDAYGINAAQVIFPSKTVLLAERYSGPDGPSGCIFNTSAAYPKQVNGVAANYGSGGGADSDPEGAGQTPILFVDGRVEVIALESLRPWPGNRGEIAGVRFAPTVD